MKPLTGRQYECLQHIVEHRKEHGYSPTVREIANKMGICVNAVQGHLNAIQEKGRIKRRNGLSRSIVPTDEVPSQAMRAAMREAEKLLKRDDATAEEVGAVHERLSEVLHEFHPFWVRWLCFRDSVHEREICVTSN